ncbi:MAG: 16S rRNA (guanine(966)-N(2))-methyltransferase RsmD [Firmicutes bacterium]|nr:16S rRNA (guanine(966)-N(2))-methyltransferase RsmD [Bacillota bacterium]MDD4263403.1 16S rRNA (guanine(966)-N(2))-methyltransferase RsmD [Bacillota bacterium]MDD4693718.1 16S rRNA (guanine(966)-N(2))-methyltransferase RsmD [Bacillota bacterium]
MRIVGGRHKGRTIKGPVKADHSKTRPTTDRVRESLFNIIAPHIRGANFLDLYAGTGAVGIEALSRGARSLTLVEKDRFMVKIIKDNLSSLGEEAEVLPLDVSKALENLRQKDSKYDIIFADPPYHLMVSPKLFELVEPILIKGGLFVLEHSNKEKFTQDVLVDLRDYLYGETTISLYMREELL